MDDLFAGEQYVYAVGSTALYVEILLNRATEQDLAEAEAVIGRLAEIPGDAWVARDVLVLRLRTRLARARGDQTGYRDGRDHYRALAHRWASTDTGSGPWRCRDVGRSQTALAIRHPDDHPAG